MASCIVRFPFAIGGGGPLDARSTGIFGVQAAAAHDNGTYYVTGDEQTYSFTSDGATVVCDRGEVYRFHFPGSKEPTSYRLIPNSAGPVDYQDLVPVVPVVEEPGYLGDTVIEGVLSDVDSESRKLVDEIFSATVGGTISGAAVGALINNNADTKDALGDEAADPTSPLSVSVAAKKRALDTTDSADSASNLRVGIDPVIDAHADVRADKRALDVGYSAPSQNVAEAFTALMTKIGTAKPNSRPKIKIPMLGSSIVRGGAVTNYDTDGPMPLFVAAMQAQLDPLGTCDWEGFNLGIDGSTANQWLATLNAWIAGVTVKITGGTLSTAGTFTLTYAGNTTAPIAYDANETPDGNGVSTAIKTALEALASIGSGNVLVYRQNSRTFSAFTVAFTGALAASVPSTLTADVSGLTGGGAKTASITVNGNPDAVPVVGGMNDLPGTAWHKTQTYDGPFGYLNKTGGLIDRAIEVGAVPIVTSTPHMHPGRVPNNGGLSLAAQASGITYPATDVYQWPGYPNPVDEMPTITLPTGDSVKVLSRFWHGNKGVKALAATKGAVFVDAELPFLIEAARNGYDSLFPAGSTFNHPTSHGIDISYGEGWRLLARSIVNARIQLTTKPAGVGGDPFPVGYKINKVRPNNAAAITTTSPTADNQLFYTFPAIVAATLWRVRGIIHYSVPAAQDGRLSWTTTGLTLASSRWAVHAPGSGAALASVTGAAPGVNSGDSTMRSAAMSTAMLIGGNGADGAAEVDAVVHVPAGGNCLLTLNEYLDVTGGTLTIYADSYLQFERLT